MKSPNPNTRSAGMPQSAARPPAEDMAAICAAGSATPPATIQSRTDTALVIVSMVVKVLEAISTSVVAGSSPRKVSAAWAPSTFEMKCVRGPS